MNRKDFLSKSAAMSVALAGLPLAKLKKHQKTFDHYYVYSKYNYPDKNITLGKFEIDLYHSALSGFDQAPESDKIIVLTCKYYQSKDNNANSLELAFKYNFTIKSVEQDKNDSAVWIVETKNAKRIDGDIEWPKELPKNPTFKIIRNSSVRILNKDENTVARLNYLSPSSSDSYCFITTACVHERNMADDCDELTTLRFLRENYMRKNEKGKTLLQEYETLGPSVVSALNQFENRKEIYDYLFRKMIQPAVAMIKKGQYGEAVDWYSGFALQLRKNYC